MTTLEKFRAIDLFSMKLRGIDMESLSYCQDLPTMLQTYEACYTLTFKKDNNAKAVIGILPLFKGTAEIFMLTTVDLDNIKFFFVKNIRRLMREALEHYKRLQCNIRVDNDVAIRHIEFLGFKRECLARKYIDGHDYYLYSYINEDC